MGKKRTNGEGCIHQRKDGIWLASVTIGRSEEGKAIRKVVYAASKTEAGAKKQALLENVRQGVHYIDADRITVSQWVDKWLETYAAASDGVRANTLAGYRSFVKNHIKPKLGDIRLQKLRPIEVQETVNKIIASGGSARLAQAVYNVLRIAVNKAVVEDILIKSPCRGIKLPKVRSKEFTPLTKKQWTALFDAARESPFVYTALTLVWATGITRSEMLALTWDDFNDKECSIFINKSNIIGAHGPELGDTKAPTRRRILTVAPSVRDVLAKQKAHVAALQLAAETWEDQKLIFPGRRGGLLDPRDFSKEWREIRTIAKLTVTFHELRHDHASRLAAKGIGIKDAQYQLGHATSRMLLDVYTHKQSDSQKKIAALNGKTFPGTQPKVQ